MMIGMRMMVIDTTKKPRQKRTRSCSFLDSRVSENVTTNAGPREDYRKSGSRDLKTIGKGMRMSIASVKILKVPMVTN